MSFFNSFAIDYNFINYLTMTKVCIHIKHIANEIIEPQNTNHLKVSKDISHLIMSSVFLLFNENKNTLHEKLILIKG